MAAVERKEEAGTKSGNLQGPEERVSKVCPKKNPVHAN